MSEPIEPVANSGRNGFWISMAVLLAGCALIGVGFLYAYFVV